MCGLIDVTSFELVELQLSVLVVILARLSIVEVIFH
jgi:hypothetical protein